MTAIITPTIEAMTAVLADAIDEKAQALRASRKTCCPAPE
jgi:hypothetical protein